MIRRQPQASQPDHGRRKRRSAKRAAGHRATTFLSSISEEGGKSSRASPNCRGSNNQPKGSGNPVSNRQNPPSHGPISGPTTRYGDRSKRKFCNTWPHLSPTKAGERPSLERGPRNSSPVRVKARTAEIGSRTAPKPIQKTPKRKAQAKSFSSGRRGGASWRGV